MPYFCNDDLSLYYEEHGSGELLLILPGNTASSACHRSELEYFGGHHHAVSLDYRGTGRSTRLMSWSDRWWEQCVEDIDCLRSHLGHERCSLMGTSGGSTLALLFALRHPTRTSCVVADSGAERYRPDLLRQEVAERDRRTDEQVAFWRHAHGEGWQEVVAHDSRLLLRLADQGGDLIQGRLSAVRCPVLFTGSLKDSFIPDIGEQSIEMARQIGDSRVFLANSGDHPLVWSRPDLFRHVAAQFIEESLR